MERLTGKQLAEALGDFVNNYNHDAEGFIKHFQRQHRTLQQSSFRLILSLIETIASDDYATDGRNEQSHAVAKKLLNGFKGEVVKQYMEQGDSRESAEKFASSEYSVPSRFLSCI
jgi:hypothetical protein